MKATAEDLVALRIWELAKFFRALYGEQWRKMVRREAGVTEYTTRKVWPTAGPSELRLAIKSGGFRAIERLARRNGFKSKMDLSATRAHVYVTGTDFSAGTKHPGNPSPPLTLKRRLCAYHHTVDRRVRRRRRKERRSAPSGPEGVVQ